MGQQITLYMYIYTCITIQRTLGLTKKKTIPQSGMGIKMETQGSTNHIICISVCVCVDNSSQDLEIERIKH